MRQKFYSGVGGIGLILNEVYRLYQDENAKAGAMEILDHYLDTSTEDNEEIYWSNNSPVFFDGGNILYLLDCCNTYKELSSKLNEIIVKATNHILNQAIDHKDGGLEIDHLHIDFKFVGLYQLTKNLKWKNLAHDVGEVLAGTKVKDHWEIAFDRTKPKVITSPAGYFTGAAGMVVALLQIFCCRYIVWRKIKMKLLD